MLSNQVHPSAREAHAETLAALQPGPVPHCSVLWCCFDFAKGGKITDLAILNDALDDLAAQANAATAASSAAAAAAPQAAQLMNDSL